MEQTPWEKIEQRFARRYRNATGKPFDLSMISEVATMSEPEDLGDRVAQGFARKAWATMKTTCELCGRRGRPRRDLCGAMTVTCASCQLPYSLRDALEAVYDNDCDSSGVGEKVVWHEHELPGLISAILPERCWRLTTLQNGVRLRYVTANELFALRPWFAKLEKQVHDNWVRSISGEA